MFPLSHKHFTKFAVAGAFVALTAVSFSIPARAGELVENSGPVGPHVAILTTVGSKRVIAFYEPDNGRCAVHAVVYEMADAYTGATTAARVRISLNPREMVHIDSADNKSLNLQCGSNAQTLSAVDDDELVAFGITIQQSEQFMRANASGF